MPIRQILAGPTLLQLDVDPDARTITLGGMERGVWGPYADWDVLCEAWPAVFEQVCAPHGGPDAFYTDERPATPLDLRAERARIERRARARRDTTTFDALRADVAAIIDVPGIENAVKRAVPKRFRREVFAEPADLADTFRFVIGLEDGPAGAVAVGASKRGGCPDLPPEVSWPTVGGLPTVLLVQLDLAALAAVDVTGRMPAGGVFQLFANAHGHGTVLLHPSREGLVRHPPVEPVQTLEDWCGPSVGLVARPGFYFRQTTDFSGPAAVARALPSGVVGALAERVGGGPSAAFSGCRVFGGDPVDWQSMGTSHVRETLFCQIEFADGHVSVGWHLDDLAMGVLDDVVVAYAGT